ncbi:hypothetical protein D7030_08365 [Flavobacteriaceae bacterium AU392]|nr:hypothetical protein D1817_00050 [Flavobacteriaceae bacterium]RKM85132.1 hypothetical protein D7030_08365 [Flavobacteriaceae bacterium AU392]
MFKNITHKQKFIAILGGFIILFMASYKKTYKHMFLAKKELNQMEQKLSASEYSFDNLYRLKNEISSLDNLIGGGDNLDPKYVQQSIFDFVSKTTLDVNIVSVEDVHLFTDREFLVYSNVIELGGTYENLVSLLYEIEKSFKDSRVISTQLYSKKNYRTKKQNLFLKITLQNYEKAI